MRTSKNYYEVLGVDEDVTSEELKKRYFKLVKKYHPDTTKMAPDIAKKNFLEITEAFEVLCSSHKKKDYDDEIKELKRKKKVKVLKEKHKREDQLWVERKIEESLEKESDLRGRASRSKVDEKDGRWRRSFSMASPFKRVPQEEASCDLRSFELPLPLEVRLKLILSLIGILTLPLFVLLFSITSTLLSLRVTGSLLNVLFATFIIYWLVSLMYLMTGFFRDKNEFYRLYKRQQFK